MARAFVFPGQGSQFVGMGVALAEAFATARHTFEEIDDVLAQKLFRLMAEGPADQLTLTENAQPALMAVSLAVTRVLARDAGIDLAASGRFVAGHSLGEYSALAAVDALSLADAATLLKRRGRAMQAAVPVGAGTMAALLGVDLEPARRIAEEAAEDEVCVPANDNAPGQVVLSGATAAIERALAIAKAHGVRKAVVLPVSAPFHCAMMQPAADAMAEALAAVTILPPRLPVIANVTATPVTEPDDIRRLLVEQVTAMVRWRESVLRMRDDDVDQLVELGAGKVLATMARRIDPAVSGVSIGTPDEIDAFVKTV